VETGVLLWVRVRSVDDTPGGQLELTDECPWHNRRLIDLLYLHIRPGLFPDLLQDLTNGAAARRCREKHLKVYRFPVLLEQLLCLSKIKG
jgi:hypothetical protein